MAGVEWWRIESPIFCCGVKVRDGQVIGTPPILDWVLVRRDRSLRWLLEYTQKRKWTLERLLPPPAQGVLPGIPLGRQ
jgi:hypothetical protein